MQVAENMSIKVIRITGKTRGKMSFSVGLFQQLSNVIKERPEVARSLPGLLKLCFNLRFHLLHVHKMPTRYTAIVREEENANSRIPQKRQEMFSYKHHLMSQSLIGSSEPKTVNRV